MTPADDVPPYVAPSLEDKPHADSSVESKEESASDSLSMPSSTVSESYPSDAQSHAYYYAPAYSLPSLSSNTDNSDALTVPTAPSVSELNDSVPLSLPRKEEWFPLTHT